MNKFLAQDNIHFLQKKNYNLYFLCLLTGILTGFTVSFYKYGLHALEALRSIFFTREQLKNPMILILLWISFILIGLFINFLLKQFPTISGSGIPQVKAIILRRLTYPKWLFAFFSKFLGGLFAIGSGLSLGREGPSVQLGSYIGFGISGVFKRNIIDKKYLVTSGAAAGLSGAFGAPLSGVVFCLEELHKYFSSKLIICILLASIASDFVGRRIFGTAPAFNFLVTYPNYINPFLHFLSFIFLGLLTGLLGKLFSYSLVKTSSIFKNSPLPRWVKISSIMTLSFTLCFALPEVTGGGHNLVEDMTSSHSTIQFLIFLFIVKLLFTVISYSTAFPGGIFLPMLVLGALFGKIYALGILNIFGGSPEYIPHYMVLGMAAFFVAVVRAPITGVILILEMTGTFEHLLALITVSLVAYLFTEILNVEPIYDILYKNLKKDPTDEAEIEDCDDKKTVILIPVSSESYLYRKKVSTVSWPDSVLIIGIRRDGVEIIPNGNTLINQGDQLIILMSEKNAIKYKTTLYKMGTGE